MAKTEIEWTDQVWNPIRGCTRISEGCRHCYAERQAVRLSGPGWPYEGLVHSTPAGPRWTGKLSFVEEVLRWPLGLRGRHRIFVNSMSDLFHEDAPDEWIEQIFAVMALAGGQVFQVLTKRARRMRLLLQDEAFQEGVALFMGKLSRTALGVRTWPPPNVWLGVSVENAPAVDERIPELLAAPAALRWISAEPLLGPISVMGYLPGHLPVHSGAKLDWVVIGGESGPGARLCRPSWIRSIVRQCRAALVPVFVKQLGAHVVDRNDAGFDGSEPKAWPDGTEADRWDLDPGRQYQGADARILLEDRKGGDPAEWPEDLRIRLYPQTAEARR
jgi:protein gp37